MDSVNSILSAVPTSASSTDVIATPDPKPERAVLAVPVDAIPPFHAVQGFKPGGPACCPTWKAWSSSPFAFWAEKTQAEIDPSAKQIIPYVIIESVGDAGTKYLTYERRTGEGRLTGLKSLGIGGHVEREDEALSEFGIHASETVRNAIQRELSEELGISPIEAGIITGGAVPIGIVNEDSTGVGQVHVGLVFRARMHVDEISIIKGSDEVVPVWQTAAEIAADLGRYEKWSQGVAGAIAGGILDFF